MSAVGPTSLGAINLAGSFAGAQRTDADSDRLQAGSAERTRTADLKALAAKSLDGVGETDQSSERDADGRLPYTLADPHDSLSQEADEEASGEGQSAESSRKSRPRDAEGERGRLLDLEA